MIDDRWKRFKEEGRFPIPAGDKMAQAKFEIFKDTTGEFRFRLVAPNGEIVAASQGYNAKVSCVEGIDSLRRYSSGAALVDSTLLEEARPRPVVTQGTRPAATHGKIWVLMCRLVQFHFFRGAWWRDTLTGRARRRFPPRCR
jgi:uncharacterized protein YegP (UPF0339 family)